MNPLQVLSRYTRARTQASAPGSRCELCAAPMAEGHRHDHLVDLQRQSLCCACRACALLFEKSGAANGRYRTVPDRVLVDPRFELSDEDWDRLEIPVRLSFLFFSSPAQRWVAIYPGAAGPTESELPLEAWDTLVGRSALLQAIQPDIEALLVYGKRGKALQPFLVPIDVCYELVALVRRHWKGFDGGQTFRDELDRFLGELRVRSRVFDKDKP